MKKKQRKKKTKRALARRVQALEEHVALQDAEREPTQAERRAEADCIREGLRAKLEEISTQRGPHTGAPEDDVILTRTALELQFRFEKMADAHEAERVRRSEELLRRCATAWTRALRGEPEKVEQDEKVIPIASAKSGGGWAGMSAAEDDYPDPDSYFNLRGSSEAEIWRESARRYGSPDD